MRQLRGLGWLLLVCSAGPGADAPAGERAGDVLSLVFDDPPQADGITLYSAKEDRPAYDTVAGKPCVHTDKPTRNYYLRFRADSGFWRQDAPVRVAVEYLDRGTGTFALKYNSASGGSGGDAAQTPSVHKTDSGEWKKVTFNLPDPIFGPNFAFNCSLTSEGWLAAEDDEWIASIELRIGGLTVTPRHLVVAADPGQAAELALRFVPGPGLTAPGKTKVKLEASAGFVEAEGELQDGEGTALFSPPKEAGPLQVTASLGDSRATCDVFAVPGKGKVTRRELMVCEFERPEGWQVSGVLIEATAKAVDGAPGGDGQATAVRFRFVEPQNPATKLDLPIGQVLPGVPGGVTLKVKGDLSNSRIWALFRDATGQLFYLPLGDIKFLGWQEIKFPFVDIRRHSGGANDGVWHLPITLYALRLLAPTRPQGAKTEGEIAIDRLDLSIQAPASVWAEWDQGH